MTSNGSVDNIKRNLYKQTEELNKSNRKLSSGLRINSAADDAAGLAIADELLNDTVELSQASRNIGDGSSLSAIQDGVYSSLGDISGRLQELATQSANGTLNDEQRGTINQEFQGLTEEANRIVQSTSFNGQNVFSGSSSIQVGTDSQSSSQISLKDPGIAQTVSQLLPLSVDSQANARTAIDQLDTFTQQLAQNRGDLGAQQSRLDSANSTVQTQRDNSIQAESRIRDLDYAEELSKRTALLISQDSSTALLAQAGKLNANIVQKLIS